MRAGICSPVLRNVSVVLNTRYRVSMEDTMGAFYVFCPEAANPRIQPIFSMLNNNPDELSMDETCQILRIAKRLEGFAPAYFYVAASYLKDPDPPRIIPPGPEPPYLRYSKLSRIAMVLATQLKAQRPRKKTEADDDDGEDDERGEPMI